jgi:cobalt-zinc-cadmium efflux system outer membrane protein
MIKPSPRVLRFAAALSAALTLAGCTVHPPGESAEREAALNAGKPFERRPEERDLPPLPENRSLDDLVNRALLVNGDLEQKYWEWRSAIEQIPQDGTQPTNLVLFAGVPIERGSTSFKRTTVTVANDPMADIQWPDKPTTAARRALEMARAFGLRFQRARYELREKVLNAYYDYSLNAELIRLEQENAQLLQTTAAVVDARNRAGAAGQQDLFKARNEWDLSKNDIANMQSQLPAQRATLNALLDRDPAAPISVPSQMPTIEQLSYSEDQVLQLAARQNPELAALAREIAGKAEGLKLARLQYLPDFSLSAGTDLGGISQNLMGMITVPILRHEAIEAAIRQAQANLRATEAMRHQTNNDLKAQLLMDLTIFHDADRQLDLVEKTIVPRAKQVVTVTRSAYEAGRSPLLDLLDSQRSLIALQRLVANLRTTRAKRLADIETMTASDLGHASTTIERTGSSHAQTR